MSQTFNGRNYRLAPGERYFRSHKNCMHWHVWEHFHGKRKKGFEIHHKDKNPWNNHPDNLELKKSGKHQAEHAKQYWADNPELFKIWSAKGIQASKEWHKSKEGLEWHKQNSQKYWSKKPMQTRICTMCKSKYESRSQRESKYCCRKCKYHGSILASKSVNK